MPAVSGMQRETLGTVFLNIKCGKYQLKLHLLSLSEEISS